MASRFQDARDRGRDYPISRALLVEKILNHQSQVKVLESQIETRKGKLIKTELRDQARSMRILLEQIEMLRRIKSELLSLKLRLEEQHRFGRQD